MVINVGRRFRYIDLLFSVNGECGSLFESRAGN